ncbi:MAG: response regulator transcription factor, partial [Oscillospiraceae bacterium]|nr:response regulator transcription factor [Oscillospiraceae bacterium]
DIKLNQLICSYLKNNGYDAKGVHDARNAYDLIYTLQYKLIITDIMLPGTDGFELAETVRNMSQTVPILIITARGDFTSKEKGFRLGIDDYMVKPFIMDELILRVSALLRRANIVNEKKLAVGSLVMDADAISVKLNGINVRVTVREFNILFKFLSYPNKTFSRQQLMDEFWDIESDTCLRAVDVYINRLRGKFSGCGDFKIETIQGLGYKAVLL